MIYRTECIGRVDSQVYYTLLYLIYITVHVIGWMASHDITTPYWRLIALQRWGLLSSLVYDILIPPCYLCSIVKLVIVPGLPGTFRFLLIPLSNLGNKCIISFIMNAEKDQFEMEIVSHLPNKIIKQSACQVWSFEGLRFKINGFNIGNMLVIMHRPED